MTIKKIFKSSLFILGICFTSAVMSMNYTSSHITLSCPVRGDVDILFHAYGHFQEAWHENFEVGLNHRTQNGIDIIRFVNGDILFHDQQTNRYAFHYNMSEKTLNECAIISEKNTKSIDLIYR